MTILFFDFESYYDSEFSLRKMSPPNYILDPRFETIGCSFKNGEHPAEYIDAPDIPRYLSGYDPGSTTTVAFNALFDNCILAWRYGFIPARMVCSMRMAVALRGHLLQSHSLSQVGKHLGVGTKGTTIEAAKGKHRLDIKADRAFYRAYQDYANNDNEMNHDIFYKLLPEWPADERRVMDRVLRCAVEPAFVCDTKMLESHLSDLDTAKVTMLDEAAGHTMDEIERGVFMTSLRSTTQFEEILRRLGVDIGYKTSLTTGQDIPAFAKSDDFMVKLQEHPDSVVQLLACARLDLRSTIEQTRGKRMLSMAQLPWERYPVFEASQFGGGYRKNSIPIPLRYSGAHTHRLSGDWKLNFQNLPSGRGGQASKLRKSLCAPEGYKVVVADKAQIECRINAWICWQTDLVNVFAAGGDPYSTLASRIFGYSVDKNKYPIERFIGKTGELGLGYGCGHVKFYNMVIRMARGLGMDMAALQKIWTLAFAKKAVDVYRGSHSNIIEMWRLLDTILGTAWTGLSLPKKIGPCVIGKGYVEGPNGLRMNYANPRWERNSEGRTELWYDYGKERHKMYGSKFLENIVQFLARINVMHDALRISDRGYRFALQAHDELAWVVPDDKVEDCKRVAREEMSRVPSWGRQKNGPSIPLAVECSHGQSYGDAK